MLEDLFEEDDEEYNPFPIYLLEYPHDYAIPTSTDLQQWSTSKCPLGDPDTEIVIDLMRYLPLDNLHELKVSVTCSGDTVFPDPALMREGRIVEESLPLMLQFIHQLTSLHTLEHGEKSGAFNLFGLKRLSIEADAYMCLEVLSFLRNRVELGVANGKDPCNMNTSLTSNTNASIKESQIDLRVAYGYNTLSNPFVHHYLRGEVSEVRHQK
ncbi:hypothetical protein F5146DRAFT_1005387 [Armillaria mellea]|nr:hypothetical protein F5146DRAFT_1005387 [Armillaria mellea]